ncbi:MAG: methylthioribulose 1-phosphate dehydratase [Acidobacteria bacterium]|nr:methylthioribulose 1-phosphate dehydratase [Acidobacteriota bacterium]MBK8809983.1 methylthioribulose 1-phosphate dehydratase [Acidobacteriota bacterium]
MSFKEHSESLSLVGYEFYRRGWVMGTAGNFSAKISESPLRIAVTASGNEKGSLDETHFLEIDDNAEVLQGFGKPSAETMVHLTIYRMRGNVGSVLHTHSVWGTILSEYFYKDGAIEIEGFEMLKGLAGVMTHEHREIVPIIENSQDYIALSHVIDNVLRENPGIHGLFLRRHGIYTWGKDIAEAKRHIEIFEFLFEVLGRTLSLR